jgi:hypothetical protein
MKRIIVIVTVLLFICICGLPAQSLGPQPVSNHTVALHADGSVYTWGWNDSGQLGNNSTSDSDTPVKVNGIGGTGDLANITAIALGGEHSIALATDGIVYTWGENNNGQLGDGWQTDSYTPVKVLEGEYAGTTYLGDNPGNKIIAIALGRVHSAALAEDGTVYAWGENGNGQLGNNSATFSPVPVRVHKGEYDGTTYLGDNPGNKIIAVALGNNHSAALAEDGTVYAWGYNFDGALGNNSTTQSATPVKVRKGEYDGTEFLGDNSNNKIIAIALGGYHSAALVEDGKIYIWGSNDRGQLGDNSTTDRHTPIIVNGEGGTGDLANITAVALGGYHSIALAADGSVYTWGENNNGQLGNDNLPTDSDTPVRVLNGMYAGTEFLGDNSNNKIVSVALGLIHSVALSADGSVYTWGYNGEGQLGDDNKPSGSATPVKVSGVGGTGDLALPVSLCSFSGISGEGRITLSWRTESETENLAFRIYRDGEMRTEVEGAGTTSEPQNYVWTDKHVIPGQSYTYVLADVTIGNKETRHADKPVTIIVGEGNIAKDFSIGKAYPNPFNPVTFIPLNLAKDAMVMATLYDIGGRPLRELQNGTLNAGSYDLHIDGANLSTGIYFVHININDAVHVQKIALMK